MIQTWLPLPSFEDSIKTLRLEELKVQRYHVLELLEFFHDPEESGLPILYEEHDITDDSLIVQMWRGYELQLIEYGMEVSEAYERLTQQPDSIHDKLSIHLDWANTDEVAMHKPNWFGDVDFHLSHQAALFKIDHKHYQQFFLWDGPKELVWPKSDHIAS